MKFTEIFEKYWDNLIIGIIAGIVLYYGLEIKSGLRSALYIFLLGLFLVLIYTFFVWAGKRYNWNKNFIGFFKKINFRKFDPKLLVSCYLFFLSIIIFSLISLLLNSFKLLHPLITILGVLFSSLIIFILFMLQKSPKENINTISLFLVLVTLVMIGLVIYISLPSEPKGINLDHLDTKFNFYVINNEINKQDLDKYVFEADKIWNKYNISVLINKTYYVNINLSDKERAILYSKGNNETECWEEGYMDLINRITNNSPNESIIFVSGGENAGRGSLCGHSFAIFRHDKISYLNLTFRDLTGRNLAHEIGHIFGLIHPEDHYKLNLMTDSHKLFYKSHYLSQKQVDLIANNIKNKPLDNEKQ
ncbi:MAG: DMT family transporter [Candidatus Pacearchaeota archaeon]|jgi:hypothetical protein